MSALIRLVADPSRVCRLFTDPSFEVAADVTMSFILGNPVKKLEVPANGRVIGKHKDLQAGQFYYLVDHFTAFLSYFMREYRLTVPRASSTASYAACYETPNVMSCSPTIDIILPRWRDTRISLEISIQNWPRWSNDVATLPREFSGLEKMKKMIVFFTVFGCDP